MKPAAAIGHDGTRYLPAGWVESLMFTPDGAPGMLGPWQPFTSYRWEEPMNPATRIALACLLIVPFIVGQGCPGLHTPQITPQLRASCAWANDVQLQNALDAAVLDRNAGFTSQQLVNAFRTSCIDSCVWVGGDEAICVVNCSSCGIAIAAEVW